MWQSPEKKLEPESVVSATTSWLKPAITFLSEDCRGIFGNPDRHRDPKFLAMTHEVGMWFQFVRLPRHGLFFSIFRISMCASQWRTRSATSLRIASLALVIANRRQKHRPLKKLPAMWQSPEKKLEPEAIIIAATSWLRPAITSHSEDCRGIFGNPDRHRDPKFLAMTHGMGFLFKLKQRKIPRNDARDGLFVQIEAKEIRRNNGPDSGFCSS
jgi:hypothetical protein